MVRAAATRTFLSRDVVAQANDLSIQAIGALPLGSSAAAVSRSRKQLPVLLAQSINLIAEGELICVRLFQIPGESIVRARRRSSRRLAGGRRCRATSKAEEVSRV